MRKLWLQVSFPTLGQFNSKEKNKEVGHADMTQMLDSVIVFKLPSSSQTHKNSTNIAV